MWSSPLAANRNVFILIEHIVIHTYTTCTKGCAFWVHGTWKTREGTCTSGPWLLSGLCLTGSLALGKDFLHLAVSAL